MIGYSALLVTTYFQLTPPSALLPDLDDLDRLVFTPAQPTCRVERLLEAGGETIEGGGSMRPAFTRESAGWEDTIKNLSEDELRRLLAEREGERLALLDWVRAGGSRVAYDSDDYRLRDIAGVRRITPSYCWDDPGSDDLAGTTRVRIRSIVTDRCVPCHSENGRHDTARFIPLETYEGLAPRLQPEPYDGRRRWLIASLAGLVPLAIVTGLVFWHTGPRATTRLLVPMVTFAALVAMLACWFAGRPESWYGPALAGFAFLAAAGALAQALATVSGFVADRGPAA
jgi:hypothetical protein